MHSVLAASVVKQVVEKHTGRYFKYYRIGYSVFATVSLIMLMIYHFSFDNRYLFASSALSFAGGMLLLIPGIILMAVCIRKYFFDLSGIDVFFRSKTVNTTLQVHGIHGYVRHPLYLGTLLMIWGVILIIPSLHHLIAGVIITVYVFAGIYWEEKKLVSVFGDEYRNYARNVPMLWPRLKSKP